jgi:hypothetical protein
MFNWSEHVYQIRVQKEDLYHLPVSEQGTEKSFLKKLGKLIHNEAKRPQSKLQAAGEELLAASYG